MKNFLIDLKREENSPTEPCTLAQAKTQCIVTFSDDDTLLTSLITKARKVIENYTNTSLVAKTVTIIADLSKEWELPYGPVTGILGVQTSAGNEGSGPASYETATSGWSQEGLEFVKFSPGGGFSGGGAFRGFFQWGPYASDYGYGCRTRYKIIYTAGYNPVPEDLVQAVLAQIAWLYEHRGEETEGNFASSNTFICGQAQRLADPYCRQIWL